MTLDRRALFERWAPTTSPWSRWAKPLLFALMPEPKVTREDLPAEPPNVAWAADTPDAAIILELPGVEAVRYAAALALAHAHAPVPLFNGAPGPRPLVDTGPLSRAIVALEPSLPREPASPDAPPCFMLESRRTECWFPPAPGKFDNRWRVFPQDFPSASFLLSRSVNKVVIAQLGRHPPADDLAHVLHAWQAAGIAILLKNVVNDAPPYPIEVRKPRGFRSLLHRALVALRLKHNSAGGFGSTIPVPHQSSGIGGGFA